MKYVAAAILIIAQITTVGYAAEISKKDQKSIVGVHNLYRGPLKLGKLEWSDDLAKTAQSWADSLEANGCPLVHSPAEIRNGYGENLYAGWSNTSGFHINFKNGVYAWAKEKSSYDYSKNVCKAGEVCGHYTQMVWGNTQRVGCAVAQCYASGQTTEILVCHYDPAGNYTGKKPY